MTAGLSWAHLRNLALAVFPGPHCLFGGFRPPSSGISYVWTGWGFPVMERASKDGESGGLPRRLGWRRSGGIGVRIGVSIPSPSMGEGEDEGEARQLAKSLKEHGSQQVGPPSLQLSPTRGERATKTAGSQHKLLL